MFTFSYQTASILLWSGWKITHLDQTIISVSSVLVWLLQKAAATKQNIFRRNILEEIWKIWTPRLCHLCLGSIVRDPTVSPAGHHSLREVWLIRIQASAQTVSKHTNSFSSILKQFSWCCSFPWEDLKVINDDQWCQKLAIISIALYCSSFSSTYSIWFMDLDLVQWASGASH